MGIDLLYASQLIQWDDSIAPMLTINELNKMNGSNENYHVRNDDIDDPSDSEHIKMVAKRTNAILDAKYKKANFGCIIKNVKSLNAKQQKALLKLLKKYETLFDGTLGDFNCDPADIRCKLGSKAPFHTKSAFKVPQIHWATLKKEIDQL
eukprot:2780552-Ditylum_brightwellii.AAC.2